MDNMRFLNVSIEVSAAPCSGACITMIIAPKTHCKHPTFPWNDSLSFKKMEDNTALFLKHISKSQFVLLFSNIFLFLPQHNG